ncbi:MAG: tRNA-dihydrouridine synthase [Oscillospiraceae bacterium]|jgi:nifR3 family TIM-barrel protein|nr:tRNA-dihydrouridine synthase [Oscillospiraceae bacterium]
MRLRGVVIDAVAALAPMAGVTDRAYRTVCRETVSRAPARASGAGHDAPPYPLSGALYTTTEMVSAKALCHQDKKSLGLLRLAPDEHPAAAQIFGSDPACMAEGALRALAISGADVIDINMGCPTPKIVKNGDGCALMRDPDRAEAVVRAVAAAVRVPVTVKMRLGWDGGSKNAAELAKRLEQAGAAGFCVHGRTGGQRYSGHADWYAVADVVRAVFVPVVANGDIFSLRDLERCLKITGAAMGMIGRAAMGNPFVFTGEEPDLPRRLERAERHFTLMAGDKGERVACLEMRRHLAWYLRGLPYASRIKREVASISEARDFDRCIQDLRGERDGRVFGAGADASGPGL